MLDPVAKHGGCTLVSPKTGANVLSGTGMGALATNLVLKMKLGKLPV